MIPRKKKICKGECGEMQYLFSKGMCKSCWAKLHKKPMKHISKSYASILDEYRPKRKAFLENRPMCELKLKGCMRVAECIHHMKSKHGKKMYLDENFWMASCIICNGTVETIGELAYELGLKIRHNGKWKMEAFDTIELERNPELYQKYQLSKISWKN